MTLRNIVEGYEPRCQFCSPGNRSNRDCHIVFGIDLYESTHSFFSLIAESEAFNASDSVVSWLTHQTGLLVVKFPSRDQVLHADGIVACTKTMLQIQLVAFFHLLQIYVNA